jgi:hypothetical protein
MSDHSALLDELTKTAAPAMLEAAKRVFASPGMHKALGGLGSGAGAGLGLGAVAGAGIEGYRGYQDARAQGGSVGDAVAGGLARAGGGAAKGAVRGALLGGALGAGADALGAGVGKTLTGLENPLGAFSRFGQRQVHGATGWTPKGWGDVAGIREMRAGGYDAARRVQITAKVNASHGGLDPKAAKNHLQALSGLHAAEDAERMGLTSIPGYARALKQHGVGALATGTKEIWGKLGPVEKALVFGPAALGVAQGATRQLEDGESRIGEVAKATVPLAGLALSPLPAMTGMVAGMGLTHAVTGADRLAKRLGRGRPELPSPSDGATVPVDREYSAASLGQAPDGISG